MPLHRFQAHDGCTRERTQISRATIGLRVMLAYGGREDAQQRREELKVGAVFVCHWCEHRNEKCTAAAAAAAPLPLVDF